MSRSFYFLWMSYFLSQIGNWIYKIALPLVIYDLTGSGFCMATLYGVEFLPWIFFSLFGGYLADKYNKKHLLFLGNLLSFAFLGGLTLIISLPHLHLTSVYIMAFLLSSIDPLIHPTFNSILPQLVNKESIVKANSSIQLVENIITLLGPMVGGGTIAMIGGKNALYFVLVTFILASICIWFITYYI